MKCAARQFDSHGVLLFQLRQNVAHGHMRVAEKHSYILVTADQTDFRY